MVLVDEQCRKKVYGPHEWQGRRCARKGVNAEDGGLWCKQHTPSVIKQRRDESYAQWKLQDAADAHRKEIGRLERGVASVAMAYMGDAASWFDLKDAVDALQALKGRECSPQSSPSS